MKVLDVIKADEQLLSWARYSIRFNDRRVDQVHDFLHKLTARNIDLEYASLKEVKEAFAQIEKEDKE